jgi:hypothetical protein
MNIITILMNGRTMANIKLTTIQVLNMSVYNDDDDIIIILIIIIKTH